MRESKLYKALVQLSGHELNRLHRFIQSPYFNQSVAILNLFEWVKADLRGAKQESSKEHIWKISFPNELFDDGRYRKLQSDLLKLVEDFYAQESFESNPIYKAKYLLEAIEERELDGLQSSALKTVQKLSDEQKLKPSSFYYYQYEIEQNKYKFYAKQSERSAKSNIENIAINLDRFYLAEKLRYYCTILNHQHLAALTYEMLFINEIIEHVEKHDYSDVPPIVIYYQILLTYRDPGNSEHYFRLKELIEKNIFLFPEQEAKEIIDAAFNYSIKRMNAGDSEYVQEAFLLYQDYLEKGLLQTKGKLDPFHFKNIVTAGLRLREFDWVENFIQKKGTLLEAKYRDNAMSFNLAQLYFYKKDYQQVIKLLAQVEYDDITYNLNSKTLLMASYYELDELEALESLLDTFRVYLSRNKEIPIARRKHYLNTIGIMRKLSKTQHGNQQAIQKLRAEVESTQGVVSKNWILEKLAHLEG